MAARKSPSRTSQSSNSQSIGPERFPHLAAFLAGYLHQDFVLDHQTPAGALKAFLNDAGPKDRTALAADWKAFRSAIEGAGWRETKEALAALGGAWRPDSRAALLALFAALEHER